MTKQSLKTWLLSLAGVTLGAVCVLAQSVTPGGGGGSTVPVTQPAYLGTNALSNAKYLFKDRNDTNLYSSWFSNVTVLNKLTTVILEAQVVTNTTLNIVTSNLLAQSVTVTGNLTNNGPIFLNGKLDFLTNTMRISRYGTNLMHDYCPAGTIDGNLFLGREAGNFTMVTNTVPNGGSGNIGIGQKALNTNICGKLNVAIGFSAMELSTTGNYAVAIGYGAGYNNEGSFNTAVGNVAMAGSDIANAVNTGIKNVAIGYAALYESTNAVECVAIGSRAGYDTGATNRSRSDLQMIFIGAEAHASRPPNEVLTNSIAIGHGASVIGSHKIVLGNTNHISTLLRGVVTMPDAVVTNGITVTGTAVTNSFAAYSMFSNSVQVASNHFQYFGNSNVANTVRMGMQDGTNYVIQKFINGGWSNGMVVYWPAAP